MLPNRVDPQTPSQAEKELFRRLQLIDDPDWPVALHSLNLAEHAWKRVTEIDFLLIGRRGVFVLEVKGGRVTAEGGSWRYTDRYGAAQVRRKSPFTQARSAMFALEQRLEQHLEPQLVRSTSFGHAVVFPDMDFNGASIEWDAPMVLDKQQVDRPDGIRRSLNRLATYWRDKPGSRERVLSDDDIERYLDVLRPDYDVVPTLRRVADAVESELASLTRKQYGAIDARLRNDRVLYEGGAGTGKTMLAVELARRSSADGKKVLLTCHSPFVAHHVSRLPGMDQVDVRPFSALAQVAGPADVLVVDEAQDLINMDALGLLEGTLTGGFMDGCWYLFLDSNNQKGLVGSYEPDAMAYLESARPAVYTLTDNCRNTATIVEHVQDSLGADVGVSTAGSGPAVEVRRYETPERGAALVAETLRGLEEQGISANEIMLLSTGSFYASLFSGLTNRWRQRIDVVDAETWQSRARTRLGFATVADFKGLESPFVLLADVLSPTQPSAERSSAYVGMTRARIGLTLFAMSEDGAS